MTVDPDPTPLRKSRLALAYLLYFLFALPGIWTFFYVKTWLPVWLLRPERFAWLILGS